MPLYVPKTNCLTCLTFWRSRPTVWNFFTPMILNWWILRTFNCLIIKLWRKLIPQHSDLFHINKWEIHNWKYWILLCVLQNKCPAIFQQICKCWNSLCFIIYLFMHQYKERIETCYNNWEPIKTGPSFRSRPTCWKTGRLCELWIYHCVLRMMMLMVMTMTMMVCRLHYLSMQYKMAISPSPSHSFYILPIFFEAGRSPSCSFMLHLSTRPLRAAVSSSPSNFILTLLHWLLLTFYRHSSHDTPHFSPLHLSLFSLSWLPSPHLWPLRPSVWFLTLLHIDNPTNTCFIYTF